MVAAARAAGAGQLRTMTLHLVPQLVGPLAVPVLFLAAGTITTESGPRVFRIGTGAPLAIMGQSAVPMGCLKSVSLVVDRLLRSVPFSDRVLPLPGRGGAPSLPPGEEF